MTAQVLTFPAQHFVMAADGQFMCRFALAAVGECPAADRRHIKAVCADSRDAQHLCHHPLPFPPVGCHAAETAVNQQMRQLVRDHILYEFMAGFSQ